MEGFNDTTAYQTVCVCVCVLTLISLAGVANATPLTNAVASYNASADDLQTSYDNFTSAQEAAYEDFQAMCNNLGLYIIAGAGVEADDYWDAYLDAEIASSSSGSALETAFYSGLLPMLTETANRLQLVINIDAQSPNEVAYVSGTAWLDLPATPFLFWKTEESPPADEFMEFEFPSLSVGDPSSYTSYTSSTLSSFHAWSSAFEGTHFIEWGHKVYGLGNTINSQRVAEWDWLCQWCITSIMLLPPNWSFENAQEFCDEFSNSNNWDGEGYCEGEYGSLSDKDKAGHIHQHFPDTFIEDLNNGPIHAGREWVWPSFHWTFPWEEE